VFSPMLPRPIAENKKVFLVATACGVFLKTVLKVFLCIRHVHKKYIIRHEYDLLINKDLFNVDAAGKAAYHGISGSPMKVTADDF
jgi:hypothetical protein